MFRTYIKTLKNCNKTVTLSIFYDQTFHNLPKFTNEIQGKSAFASQLKIYKIYFRNKPHDNFPHKCVCLINADYSI